PGTPSTPSTPDTPDLPSTPAQPEGNALPFTDVAGDAWYYADVVFVYENGMMEGTSATTFAPDLALTRGMVVTMLYRLEQEPTVSFAGVFADVSAGLWYTNGVEWAAGNGIVNGYPDGGFGPNDPVTREQLAAILYRYAAWKGLDVGVGEDTNLLSYTDALAISPYAVEAMQWACGAGLLNGAGGMLMPRDSATRAQVAAIFTRFLSK
ncbi:MAG: S-layer homology domain-containing protein, partial [Faecousia sp.]